MKRVVAAALCVMAAVFADDVGLDKPPLCTLDPSAAAQYPNATLTANCDAPCSSFWTQSGTSAPPYCVIVAGKLYKAFTPVTDDIYSLVDAKTLGPIVFVETVARAFSTVKLNNLGIASLAKSIVPAGSTATLATLDLTNNALMTIASTFPSTLTTLTLDKNKLTTIHDMVAPLVTTLSLKSNAFTAVPLLPAKIVSLAMDFNLLTSVAPAAAAAWPTSITSLSFANNAIIDWPTTLPDNVQTLNLQTNKLDKITITALPPSLKVLCLGGNPISSITVSPAALGVLKSLSQPRRVGAVTSTCDSTSSVFAAPPPASACGPSAHAELLWDGVSICVTGAALSLPDPKSGASMVVVSISLALITLLLVAICIQRRRARLSPHWYDEDESKYYGLVDAAQLDSDIRYDDIYAPFHIPAHSIERQHVLASGGFGVVYLATLHPSPAYPVITAPVMVAMKRMLPEKAAEVHSVEDFMEEIRLSARLYHKNIVKFVGFSWTSLQNLCALTEYMENGDLWTYMTEAGPSFGWGISPYVHVRIANSSASKMFSKSSFSNTVLSLSDDKSMSEDMHPLPVSKFTVLCNVVEALVYLHSMDPPIIHRDLKTKNVLLNALGVAKLTDFGVSRETSVDTMTAEIGTVAWIAPEVLKGIYYSEKADIYSLGVLISEMDTVQIPYSNIDQVFPEFQQPMDIQTAKTRIAMLVVAGDLRPTFSSRCPRSIEDVAMRCLSYDPDRRPHVHEVWDWLQLIKQAVRQS
ncbi:Aste57867_13515 [Aphanomyces stellatus]|uniref:Aste57867_13515 protein n=1 Tax=Aphanomyces stellatus TaxID=120398 RepID=A0A485KYB6_9STRA|nr:hypothetical protein As57867_013465 [Aphanomyces stellatus]VFT90353.1 Aste57867_13515 [Aphanomyces stellatus]